MKWKLIFFSILISSGIYAQYLDKSFYLVDSLDISVLSETDKQLLDTMLEKVHGEKHDTVRLQSVNFIVEQCWNDEVWPKYNLWLKNRVEQKLSVKNSEKEKLIYTKILASTFNNLGYLNKYQGKIPDALRFYSIALKIQLDLGDKRGAASTYNNLGRIYGEDGDTVQQLNYYHKSLSLKEELKDLKGIALTLNNIGYVLGDQKKYDKQFFYYQRSLSLAFQIDDKKTLGFCYNNLGYNYMKRAEQEVDYTIRKSLLDSSLYYNELSLHVRKLINDKPGVAFTLHNLSKTYELMGKSSESLKHSLLAYNLAKEVGYPILIRNSAEQLMLYYEKKGNKILAFDFMKEFILMRDSLDNIENAGAVVKQRLQFEYESKKISDSLENVRLMAIKDLEVDRVNLIVDHQKKQRIWMTVGLFALLGFLGYVVNRFRHTRKQKNIIENAHRELELKNNMIIDSIDYAKRIQRAMLPSREELEELFFKAFTLYHPKDIVSGDFYWGTKLDDEDHTSIFATADCTGHGVPGAFMSLVGFSLLEKIVNQLNFSEPAEILNQLHLELYESLRSRGQQDVVDGMDITVIRYSKKHKKIWFAGARNSLILASNGKMKEYRGDRIDIGANANPYFFTEYQIDLKSGDCVYLFTDGYQDQKGGETGRRLYSNNFKDLLLKISILPFEEQHKSLNEFFNSWKQGNEQLDDILVFGMECI